MYVLTNEYKIQSDYYAAKNDHCKNVNIQSQILPVSLQSSKNLFIEASTELLQL